MNTGSSSSHAGSLSKSQTDRASISGRTSRLSETTTSDREPRDGQESGNVSLSGQTAGTGAAGSVVGEVALSAPALQCVLSFRYTTELTNSLCRSPGPSIPTQTEIVQPPIVIAPSKPKVTTYDKAIQTIPIAEAGTSTRTRGAQEGDVSDADEEEKLSAKTPIATEAEIRARILKEIEVQKEIDRLEAQEQAREAQRRRDEALPAKELDGIFQSAEFQVFLDTSSKFVERALNDDYDYLRDYTIGDGELSADEQGKQRVKRVCAFYDERWCKNRSVTSLEWSPKFPELCVAAYNKNPMSMSDPDGIACVWNLHLVDRPEFVFHSQVSFASKICLKIAHCQRRPSVGCPICGLLALPSQPPYRRYICRPDPSLGHAIQIVASIEVASECLRAHSPRVFALAGWDAERAQPHIRLNGRDDLFMDARYARSATGDARALASAAPQDGRSEHNDPRFSRDRNDQSPRWHGGREHLRCEPVRSCRCKSGLAPRRTL